MVTAGVRAEVWSDTFLADGARLGVVSELAALKDVHRIDGRDKVVMVVPRNEEILGGTGIELNQFIDTADGGTDGVDMDVSTTHDGYVQWLLDTTPNWIEYDSDAYEVKLGHVGGAGAYRCSGDVITPGVSFEYYQDIVVPADNSGWPGICFRMNAPGGNWDGGGDGFYVRLIGSSWSGSGLSSTVPMELRRNVGGTQSQIWQSNLAT